MVCEYCGQQLDDEADFCPNCGNVPYEEDEAEEDDRLSFFESAKAFVRTKTFLYCLIALAGVLVAAGIFLGIRWVPFYSASGVQACVEQVAGERLNFAAGGEIDDIEISDRINKNDMVNGRRRLFVVTAHFTGNAYAGEQYFGMVVTKTKQGSDFTINGAMQKSYTSRDLAVEYMGDFARFLQNNRTERQAELDKLTGPDKKLDTPALEQAVDNIPQMTVYDYEAGYRENTRKFYEWAVSAPQTGESPKIVDFFVQVQDKYYQYFVVQNPEDPAVTFEMLTQSEDGYLHGLFEVKENLRYDSEKKVLVLSEDGEPLVVYAGKYFFSPDGTGSITKGHVYSTEVYDENQIEDGYGNKIVGGIGAGTYRVTTEDGKRVYANPHPTDEQELGGQFLRSGAVVDVDATVENWAHVMEYGWVPDTILTPCDPSEGSYGNTVDGVVSEVIRAGADLISGIISALF